MTAVSAWVSHMFAWPFGSAIEELPPSSTTTQRRGGREGVPRTTGSPHYPQLESKTEIEAIILKQGIKHPRARGATHGPPLHGRPMAGTELMPIEAIRFANVG